MADQQSDEPIDQGSRSIRGNIGVAGSIEGVGVAVGHGASVTVHQVQVYAAGPAEGTVAWRRFLEEHGSPYKLTPFRAEERWLFSGREAEINRVLDLVGAQQSLIVYGPPDVGKTSLLAAGVIPRLVANGAVAVHLRDYLQPVAFIQAALLAHARQGGFDPPPDASLEDLAHTIVTARGQGLVLVLDQFERLFAPETDEAQREVLQTTLERLRERIEPSLLRVLVSTRDTALARLQAFRDTLPDLWQNPLELAPFDREQAREAIETPATRLDAVSYVGNMVEQRLVPDLDALTPDDPFVGPGELQIVCHWLFQAARERQQRYVDESLYQEVSAGKGAEAIMAAHLDRTLETRLAGQAEIARSLLVAMAAPTADPWMSLEQLTPASVSPEEVRTTVNSLVAADLLIWRMAGDEEEFTFASHAVAQAARRLGEESGRGRYEAPGELSRIWSSWLARDALPGPEPLRYLAGASDRLAPRPVQSLLLLRATVTHALPPEPWLAALDSDAGRSLVRQLEAPNDPAITHYHDQTSLGQAALLIGVASAEAPGTVGAVSWAAATGASRAARETAALALLLAYGDGLLTRLEAAWEAAGTDSAGRLALRGALAEAHPPFAQKNQQLPLLQRWQIWAWRFRRRLQKDWRPLVTLPLGGAAGAGVGLGLMRALLSLPRGRALVATNLALYSYWGAILAFALALGLLLVATIRLQEVKIDSDLEDTIAQKTAMGAIFFGIAHFLVAWANGFTLVDAPLVLPLGFVAGLGLALALNDRPWQKRLAPILARSLGVALLFALIQTLFILAEDQGTGLAIVWGKPVYESQFGAPQAPWPTVFALLDSAAVGIILTLGTAAGMAVAAGQLARWRHLQDRSYR